MILWYNKFGFDNTHTTHTHTQKKNNNKTLLIEKSGSNDNNNNNNRKVRECHNHNPQPTPDTKRKRKRTKINTCKIFFFSFFQHIKMSKAFTLEKSQKKKNAFCLWHVRPFILLFMAYAEPVYSLFRTPTLPYRAQPLLYATGKMSLNWGLDCSSICCMHAPAANCLPSFGRAIGWTMIYE